MKDIFNNNLHRVSNKNNLNETIWITHAAARILLCGFFE